MTILTHFCFKFQACSTAQNDLIFAFLASPKSGNVFSYPYDVPKVSRRGAVRAFQN